MAWVADAQAVVVQKLSPRNPVRMATWPAAMLPIIMGTKNGEMRPGPFARYLSCSSSILPMPPMPQPMIVPTRYGSISLKSVPASCSAWMADATAICVKRSMWRMSLRSKYSAGSKSRIMPATLTPSSVVSKLSILETPSVPFFIFSQNFSTVLPSGFTVPSPVITTLFIFPRSLPPYCGKLGS